MKAIVISAGKGSRLLPLTLQVPKCLVEVNGRAILDHQILALRAAGIEEIVIVGGYRVKQIAEHLEKALHAASISLLFNPFWSVASSIGSVWEARRHLEGPFCLLNGDTIFDGAVIEQALASMRPGVNLLVEPITAPEHDDMRVHVEHGRVAAVAKDLPDEISTHRSLGVVLCPDGDGGPYRKALEVVIGGRDGYNAYHHAVVDLLARSSVVTPILNQGSQWREIDRPEDIERWTSDHTVRPDTGTAS